MIVIDYRQLLDKIDNPPYTLYSAGDRAAWLDECIATAHAFDAEPVVHGRWKITENVLSYEGTFDFIGCSKCGKGLLNDLCENNGADYVNVENDFLFCPFCGAKMEGDSDEL